MALRTLQQLGSRLSQTTTYNERVLYGEVAFQAIIASGAVAFVNVFLVRLGAADWLVGLFTSLPALAIIVTALPAGTFVQRQANLVATANGARTIYRATIGLFALLPLLPSPWAAYVLVAAYTLISIPGSVSNLSITTILGMATSIERRPRMLSTRLAINGLVAAIVGFLAGQWLDATSFPWNYQVLFVVGALSGGLSIYMLSRLRLPPRSAADSQPHAPLKLRQMFDAIRAVPLFRNYCVAAFVFRIGLSLPSALYAVYRVRNVGASDAWIGLLLTVENLLSVFTYLALSRLLSRPFVRRWLWLSCPAIVLYPLTLAMATTPPLLLLPSLSSGLFGAAMTVFITNTLFQVSPEDERPTFVAADVLLANVAAFLAPMMGTALAGLIGIRAALLVIAAIRLFGGLSFWFLRVEAGR